MSFFLNHFHQEAEDFKVISFGIEFELMSLEKRNNYFREILAVVDLISVAILMVWSCIFLEIHTSALKEFLQSIENVFVLFDKFDIELWLNDCTSYRLFFFINISNVDSEASFTVYKAHNIVWCKTVHFE